MTQVKKVKRTMAQEKRTFLAGQSTCQAMRSRQKSNLSGVEVRFTWRMAGYLRELGLE